MGIFFEKREMMSAPVQIFVLAFTRVILEDIGGPMDEGIILIADDMLMARHFIKAYVAKVGNGTVIDRKMPKTVQKYLGHATLQMTMDLYTAVMPKHLSSEMEKLDDELEKISQSGEELIDPRYKKEKQKGVITFPDNTLVV